MGREPFRCCPARACTDRLRPGRPRPSLASIQASLQSHLPHVALLLHPRGPGEITDCVSNCKTCKQTGLSLFSTTSAKCSRLHWKKTWQVEKSEDVEDDLHIWDQANPELPIGLLALSGTGSTSSIFTWRGESCDSELISRYFLMPCF